MRLSVLLFLLLSVSSCVSTKVFNDLESRYAQMKDQRNALEKAQDSLQQSWDRLNDKWNQTSVSLNRSRDSVARAIKEIQTLEKKFALLK